MKNIYKAHIRKEFTDYASFADYQAVAKEWLIENVGIPIGDCSAISDVGSIAVYQTMVGRLSSIVDISGVHINLMSESWGSKWRIFSTHETGEYYRQAVYVCLRDDATAVMLKLALS
jgi:hypothetical protein